MLSYLCQVVGEPPDKIGRLHGSTVRRIKASAIAIHIPVLLWGITGFVLSAQVFKLDRLQAAGIAGLCALLIYLVERLVLATPKTWYVNVGRVAIGIVIAVLGASTVDLVIFDREVSQQLRQSGEARLEAGFSTAMAAQTRVIEQSKGDWLAARAAANCEANGTCGSRIRNVGPVYRELAREAATLREDYVVAQRTLEELAVSRDQALAEWQSSPLAVEQAGLLTRVEALHQYTMQNKAAFCAWLLFFLLVLFFESMVVLVKLVFGETVDDRIEVIRERISDQRASAYLEAVTSPVAEARRLIEGTYG